MHRRSIGEGVGIGKGKVMRIVGLLIVSVVVGSDGGLALVFLARNLLMRMMGCSCLGLVVVGGGASSGFLICA